MKRTTLMILATAGLALTACSKQSTTENSSNETVSTADLNGADNLTAADANAAEIDTGNASNGL